MPSAMIANMMAAAANRKPGERSGATSARNLRRTTGAGRAATSGAQSITSPA